MTMPATPPLAAPTVPATTPYIATPEELKALAKMTPAQDAEMRQRALALVEKYKREGVWTGGVVPHYSYQKRPLAWIVEKLGVPEHTLRWSMNAGYADHKWDGDVDPLITVLDALADWKDVGVESATGVGKTFIAACIVLWFLACFPDSIVSTIAPKEEQLLKHVWKEIGALFPKFKLLFPQSELLPGTGVLRMKPAEEGREKWAASAFVCGVGASEEVATKAQGLHAEHMLLITEETPGIDPAIMEALDNTRTDDHNLHLALGNPDHQQDELHKFCLLPGVVYVRISALDHPNIVSGQRIVPGSIGRDRLERRTQRLGKGSRLYESRVRGICPKEAQDALIKWEWCVAAAKKYDDPAYRIGPRALGVDVADSPTGDKASISDWLGACCTSVDAFNVAKDAEDVADRVYAMATDEENPVSAKHIGVDVVGVGASTYNSLNKRGIRARKISSAAKAIPAVDTEAHWEATEEDEEGEVRPVGPKIVESEAYGDLRDQVHWRGREDLRMGRVAMPYDEELFQDLCAATYTTKNGKIEVAEKDKVRRILGRSPNKGDSWLYGNFVRRRSKRPARSAESHSKDAAKPVNRDRGLEKFMKAHNERQARRDAQFKRTLKQRFGRKK